MHTIFLRGGLGNQFFQWIYALYLQENGLDVCLDASFLVQKKGNQAKGEVELNNIFTDLFMPIYSNFSYLRSLEPFFIRAAHFASFLRIEDRKLLTSLFEPKLHYGYYQKSYFFTEAIKSKIYSVLNLNILSKNSFIYPPILTNNSYCAIHIRGGDYNNSTYNSNKLGLLSSSYYQRVFNSLRISKESFSSKIVIVSDDEKRARKILNDINLFDKNIYFLSDISQESNNSLVAFSVMFNAKKLVCANSSFSAMCGYLNLNANISYPQPWFKGEELFRIQPGLSHWNSIQSSFETQ